MRPTFTVDNQLTLEGEANNFLNNLTLWFDNKFFFGKVNHDSFTIKEIGRGLWDKITDSTHVELVTTIEGKIDKNRINLSAELNSGHKIQVYVLRTFIILFGTLVAIGNMDWIYSPLTLTGTVVCYLYVNYLIRKRIKRDLDTFIWIVNTRTSNRIK